MATSVRADEDMLTLAKARNCTTCHAVDRKVLGPAYRDVAKKFAGNPQAEAELVERVLNGSKGAWGSLPMPPNNVSREDATRLVRWILSLN